MKEVSIIIKQRVKIKIITLLNELKIGHYYVSYSERFVFKVIHKNSWGATFEATASLQEDDDTYFKRELIAMSEKSLESYQFEEVDKEKVLVELL